MIRAIRRMTSRKPRKVHIVQHNEPGAVEQFFVDPVVKEGVITHVVNGQCERVSLCEVGREPNDLDAGNGWAQGSDRIWCNGSDIDQPPKRSQERRAVGGNTRFLRLEGSENRDALRGGHEN
jgi:hypothetical protein